MKKKYIAMCAAIIFSVLGFSSAGNKTEAAVPSVKTGAVIDISADRSAEQALTEDEISLIALVTMAEAEGECEKGQRLVIDVILNRIDSDIFPGSTAEVIYQPNQFPSMTNGRAARCKIDNDICRLVREELENRTNDDVIFFRTGQYSEYGYPLFKVGSHYFSGCY